MQEVDRGSRNPASHEHQKMREIGSTCIEKSNQPQMLCGSAIGYSEAQAATGSSMELTLG